MVHNYKRKTNRSSWSKETIQHAIEAIRKHEINVVQAAKSYGIPRRTLRRHLQNESITSVLGRKPILTTEQEMELSERLKKLAKTGYPLTVEHIKYSVYQFCVAKDIKNSFKRKAELPGRYWFLGFQKRHPELSIKKNQKLNPARAQKMRKLAIHDHFVQLKNIIVEIGISTKPEAMYSMDERECCLTLYNQVVAQSDGMIASENDESVTVVVAGNAAGSSIPPFVLFKGKKCKPEWLENLPTGAVVHMTPKGSMANDPLIAYLYHFNQYRTKGPCLLIFDGSKGHLDYSVVEVAETLGITLYCLPNNTTHELQPMNKGCCSIFEKYWDQEVMDLYEKQLARNTHVRNVSKQTFSTILSIIYDKALTPSNITSGFEATGIYPWNPEQIPENVFVPRFAVGEPQPGSSDSAIEKITVQIDPLDFS